MITRVGIVAAILFLSSSYPRANPADFEHARQLYQSGAYEEARKELESPPLKYDPAAASLLGEMMRDGKGGERDLIEAYKLFSLVFMLGDPDARATGAAMRRQIARQLTIDQIKEGERRVIVWVDDKLGKDARKKQVEQLTKELSTCDTARDECYTIVQRVFEYGPAAPDAVPALANNMTRDLRWINRNWYAYGMAVIGTASVQALSQTLLDETQIRTEGTWNARQAADALGAMGPTAKEALPSLLQAIEKPYSDLGGTEFMKEMSGGVPADFISELKLMIADAIVKVSDPQRVIHDGLTKYLSAERDMHTRLAVAWAIGLVYREPKLGIELASQVIGGKDEEAARRALVILVDFAFMPEAGGAASKLLPRVREIASSDRSGLKEVARNVLEAMTRRDLEDAVRSLQKGDFNEAQMKSDAVTSQNPWGATAFIVSGEARRERGDIEGAIKNYNSALDLSPTPYWYLGAIAEAGLHPGDTNGEVDKAIRDLLPKCVRDQSCFSALKKEAAGYYQSQGLAGSEDN